MYSISKIDDCYTKPNFTRFFFLFRFEYSIGCRLFWYLFIWGGGFMDLDIFMSWFILHLDTFWYFYAFGDHMCWYVSFRILGNFSQFTMGFCFIFNRVLVGIARFILHPFDMVKELWWYPMQANNKNCLLKVSTGCHSIFVHKSKLPHLSEHSRLSPLSWIFLFQNVHHSRHQI